MASVSTVEEHLTCSICLNVFNTPKTLPCLHTFCEVCLKDHVDKTKRDGSFMCPLCNADTAVPKDVDQGFKTNFHLSAMVDELKLIPMCDICLLDKKQVPAKKCCLQCSDKLCDACCESHSKTRPTRGHQLDDLASKEQDRVQTMCPHHKNEPLRLFCEDCETPVCILCNIKAHNKHTATTLDEAITRAVTTMETEMKSVRHNMETAKKCVGDYENAQGFCDDEVDRIGKIVDKKFDDIYQTVNKKKEQVLGVVRKSGTSLKEELDERKRGTSQQHETMITSLNNAQRVLDCENRIEVLNQYKGTMQKLIEARELAVTCIEAKPLFSVELCYIPECCLPDIKADLKLEREVVYRFPQILPKAKLVSSFNTRLAGEGGSWCHGIHYNNDTYLVADYGNQKVKIFDINGQYQGLLDKGDYQLQYPSYMTTNKEGDIFVMENSIKGVVVYDKYLNQKKVARGVYKGSYGGITCDNNRLILGDQSTTLTVLDMNCVVQCVVDANKLGLDKFNPFYTTTSPTGNIIVCDYQNKRVYILDNACTRVLHTYNPEGELALQYPWGVACDRWGHIIIADYTGHCLHVISAEGEHLGVIVTKEDGLKYPSVVAICGRGQVAVLEYSTGDVKVYKYLDI